MREPIILNLSQYVKPVVVESPNEDFVLNGKKNHFWDYILDRYNGSPTNAAIIDAYVDRVYGKGLSIINASSNATEFLKIKSILTEKECRKLVMDFIMFGSAVGQVRYSKSSQRTIAKIEHLERKYVAPGKMDEKGEINTFWFCQDWGKTNIFKPKSFPKFGTSNKNIEIFEIRPYKAGKDYYADPSYLPGLQYAKLEEEIANYSVNHIMNGLSAGYVLNFNEGSLPEEVKEEYEAKIKRKLTGSKNAGKMVISFNDSPETAPTVTAFPTNTSHEEWQLWTDIARQQIMVSHRVTSPMLFGIKDNTGLGNNANELRESTELLHETVTRPKQNQILEVLADLFMVNNLSSPLVFIPLEDEEEKEEAKKEALPTEEELELSLKAESKADELIQFGEPVEQDDWECILTEEVDYELEDTRDAMLQLTSTGVARPNAKSEQDSEQFKVRYQYGPQKVSANSRGFCKKMVAASKVYRKEDIIRMGSLPVNPGWGPGGTDTYSIWLYKGGGGCHHKWMRKTYVKKGSDVDVNSPLAEIISTAEARRRGDRTVNEPQVSVKPKDMPNKGFL